MKQCLKIIPYLLAVIGGIFLGQFSCGGYVWHKQAIEMVLVFVTLAVVLIPMRNSPPSLRVAFIIGAAIVFILANAISAAFYPAAPESWGEFIKLFAINLESGAC